MSARIATSRRKRDSAPYRDVVATMSDSASKTSTDPTTFDAIVVGSGIAGGWAAKELCDKGLKTLVPERGRNVEHIKDYPTANLAPMAARTAVG